MSRDWRQEEEKTRRRKDPHFEADELRRKNELETLAIQVGLSYSTVMDLLNSGWKYSEVPGLKPRWIKVN